MALNVPQILWLNVRAAAGDLPDHGGSLVASSFACAMTGLIRGLLHIAYFLRSSVLVPLVIGDFVIVVLVRLASFYADRPTPGKQVPEASSVSAAVS